MGQKNDEYDTKFESILFLLNDESQAGIRYDLINMYYYINHQTAEANNTITWGLPDHPISDTLYQYMKLLLEKVEDDEVRLPNVTIPRYTSSRG